MLLISSLLPVNQGKNAFVKMQTQSILVLYFGFWIVKYHDGSCQPCCESYHVQQMWWAITARANNLISIRQNRLKACTCNYSRVHF